MIVTCPKCGQALMNEDNRTLTDTEAAELALQTCNCPAARAGEVRKSRLTKLVVTSSRFALRMHVNSE